MQLGQVRAFYGLNRNESLVSHGER
jgi:hypothetical protein